MIQKEMKMRIINYICIDPVSLCSFLSFVYPWKLKTKVITQLIFKNKKIKPKKLINCVIYSDGKQNYWTVFYAKHDNDKPLIIKDTISDQQYLYLLKFKL